MSEPRYTQLAARLLRQARTHIGPRPATVPADAVAQLADTIRSAAIRRRLFRAGRLTAATVAAICLSLILGWKVTHPKRAASAVRTTDASAAATSVFVAEGGPVATVLSVGGSIQPLLPGQSWHSGDHLRTADSPVDLTANDQSSVEVEPHSDLELLRTDAERWLKLGSGAVEVHVAKLKAGERFVIATPDAEVEVRGTRFHVAIVPAIRSCGQGTVTRVSVTEGIVVVRSSGVESRVLAGTRWPFGCQTGQVSVPEAADDDRAAPKRAPSPQVSVARTPMPLENPTSTLATENDLFSASLKAEGRGDAREALHLLDLLLSRFPTSPLNESAAFERARLVGSLQRGLSDVP